MVTCLANTLDTDNATDLTCQMEEQEQEGARDEQRQASDCNETSDDTCSVEAPDEEQLSRILQCKRLSEGCNLRFNLPTYLARKNSLHSMMMGEGANAGLLPPVTEGEPMRHLTANNQQQQQQQQQQSHALESGDSHSSSNSLRSASYALSNSSSSSLLSGQHRISKRHSQDDSVATTCSSSTSLDGKSSPTGHANGLPMMGASRRRSSTVSQCSSVLSEGARQQLNFNLSPDLAPDSSILEANAVCAQSPLGDCSPDSERPASPEPLSPSALSDERSCELRPMSRMSGPFNFDDDDDDHDHDDDHSQHHLRHLNHEMMCDTPPFDYAEYRDSETANHATSELKHEAQIKDNLERIISEVSSVQVSQEQQTQLATDGLQQADRMSNKRAHTPFGANIQRNKVGPIGATSLGSRQQQQPSLSPGV